MEWEQQGGEKAGVVAQGRVSAVIQDLLSRHEVDGCSEYITMCITRFRHVWFLKESQSESKYKYNTYCVKLMRHYMAYCCRDILVQPT